MQLHLCTWQEVERYLETSSGIIFPIGSTEQHGPTGLIGTDAICAEVVAKGVGESTGAIVGPTINVGMALHHAAFPGSMSLRPSTLIQVIQDYLVGLSRSGFRRFFFINGHGGNVATLKAAFSETYARLADLQIPGADQVHCKVNNWYMNRDVYQLAKELYGDREGSHATPSEVAVTQFVYPEAIKDAPLSAEVASGFPIYGAADFRRHYPDGRMGSDPSLATPEHGQQLYEKAVDAIATDYQKFLAAD
ncbi:Creatinine amidohydrolase [Acaryochloris thomasi RCC1774]|uniref:Creatinine amidohydrolase n=1 Tax=Acaryochloris thomasi RCC1774 TaxID=1764569 RepID=A0A2W1K3P3_9CYAN|nr:creatininase family protein [Acaryochloris thomasi]PZD74721.1 Creatinine amidohydrolase [Acaryochloris thomasi RCC1774]